MFALKAEHISKAKKPQTSCSLSRFLFIDFVFLSGLAARGTTVTIWESLGIQ